MPYCIEALNTPLWQWEKVWDTLSILLLEKGCDPSCTLPETLLWEAAWLCARDEICSLIGTIPSTKDRNTIWSHLWDSTWPSICQQISDIYRDSVNKNIFDPLVKGKARVTSWRDCLAVAR